MQRLARLRALSPRDRRLLAEAMATLALAALAVALLPLRTIGAFVGRPARRTASMRVRPRHIIRSAGWLLNSRAVASSTRPATTEGWRRARSSATGPPIE